MKSLKEQLEELGKFDITESLKMPDKNYMDEDSIRKFWIPDTETKLRNYETSLNDIMNANRDGAYIQDDFLKIGDIVKCEYKNGAVLFGQVKEFACTFEGKLFPILIECKKDLTPKKSIMSATWLEKNMLKITKYNI
jgi:hypothetical protein